MTLASRENISVQKVRRGIFTTSLPAIEASSCYCASLRKEVWVDNSDHFASFARVGDYCDLFFNSLVTDVISIALKPIVYY